MLNVNEAAFENVQLAPTTLQTEYAVVQFLKGIWGESFVNTHFDTLIAAVVKNATNCARFCRNAYDFETVCNGMRNCYLDATAK